MFFRLNIFVYFPIGSLIVMNQDWIGKKLTMILMFLLMAIVMGILIYMELREFNGKLEAESEKKDNVSNDD